MPNLPECPQVPSKLLRGFSSALVVDDDEALRRSVSRWLRSAQMQVSEAKSVAEATRLLARDHELLLVDIRLPDGNGHAIVELAGRKRPAPLIVAMSGLASAREAFALAQSGARVYLTKPFAQEDLIDGLAHACEDLSDRTAAAISGERDLAASLLAFAERFSVPEREMALVRLATAGVPRTRCPDMLGVSENTCKTLTRRLLQRCGARSLAQIPRLVLIGNPSADA